ncbi:hypothetical protein [Stenotrophomonas oahuensis]|uniref:Uncharacterized protein n=1 Tax=Stenotrophomonas oahuensis TaxID=3003271 RepID=A0ABY9YTI2_9GAMM|nr:hypothetical protein [Stenotrophomonas sp. A5586]WNH54250.1 hypothetical protein PDM29_08235 [Stenotrophomonas sp. A5586]
MTDLNLLRKAFAECLGQERFLKFLAQGFRPRLKFWQEQEVDRFYATHSSWHHDIHELEAALRFCHVHERDLLPCSLPTFNGCLTLSSTYIRERSAQFPNAAVDARLVPDGGPSSVKAWYCPECRLALERWHCARRRERGIPDGLMLFTVVEALHIKHFNMLAIRVAEDLAPLNSGGSYQATIVRPDGTRRKARPMIEHQKREPFTRVFLSFHGLEKSDVPVGSTIEVMHSQPAAL